MKAIPANKDDIFYRIALSEAEHIGVKTAKKLIGHFGSAREVFRLSTRELMQVQGMSLIRANSIASFAKWEKIERELEYAEKNGIRVLSFTDTDYPNRLKHCEDAPPVLFVKGEADLSARRILSVVGTRRSTEYGRQMTRTVIKDLAPYNVLVVSGLAYGIDFEAHRACVEYGIPTVAVLGHGLNKVYPSSHAKLAGNLVKAGGALVSEFTTETKPDRENFPMRNRIVAGMCDATLVVESGVKGGSMITADLANGYHRDVFAIPGKVGDARSEGCNRLIKSHRAALFESVKDFEYIMGWSLCESKTPIQKKIFVDLKPEEEAVLNVLREKKRIQVDELCLSLKIPVSSAMVYLLNLELNGLVRSLPGKFYEAC